MGTTAESAEHGGVVEKLGVKPGMLVQELGRAEDIDQELRAAVEQRAGTSVVGPDSDEVVDVVLLWWREGDGDLVDELVDALTSLADDGVIWLLTPKVGREGHVEPSDVNDAAPTAGLTQTTALSAGREWSGARLVAPKAARSRR